jgi:DNA-binding MarR family transcriptional regulator
LDAESRTTDEDHQALRLWLRLLACTNLIEAPLRRQLRGQFAGSLPRFDLMAQLDRHPQGLKMRELSRRLMVTGGNVTGLTDRLVAEGLVQRRDDPADRRTFIVSLTPEGKRQFRAMARAHEGWIVALLGGLAADEQAQLYELLGRLKDSLKGSVPAPPNDALKG